MMASKWYAAKLRELDWPNENPFALDRYPDAFEICEVPAGVQAHLMNPRPLAWGYYDTRQAAEDAVTYDDFASYRSGACSNT